MKFKLTQDHITLIQSFNVVDYGTAPSIDEKRPFGNSDIVDDMIEILHPDFYSELSSGMYDSDSEKYQSLEDEMYTLYNELNTALSIVFSTLSFKPGIYTNENNNKWELIEESTKTSNPLIVVDYDETFTVDKRMFSKIINDFKSNGYRVICCTMRVGNAEYDKDVIEDMEKLDVPIVFAAEKPNKEIAVYHAGYNITDAIWIDDSPEWIKM